MKNKLNLPSKIHFIGIGGAGMNPLAGICLKEGIKVTGSDSTQNKNQDELRALGADIWTPHSAEELAERELPDICVYSTAIPDNNPEVIYLKEKGVQFWHRSDLLEKIANNFEKQIVIAGTHGKTTTTAMLVWILEKAGLKPCWVLGGVLKGLGSYGWSDQREIFVFEGDESDQSFLKSKPYIGVVTSLEPDHLENYNNSFDEQIKKFKEFADKCENFICSLAVSKYFVESKPLIKIGNLELFHRTGCFANLCYALANDYDVKKYPDQDIAVRPTTFLFDPTPDEANIWDIDWCWLTPADTRFPMNASVLLDKIKGEHNYLNALGALSIVEYLHVGSFGLIYNQFKGKPKEAIEYLLKVRTGEAVAALYHQEIGNIDLVWGEAGTGKGDGFGLAKLEKYHPEVLSILGDLIPTLSIIKRTKNRIQVESNDHKASGRVDWESKRKIWLLTAFEKEESLFSRGRTDISEAESPAGKMTTSPKKNSEYSKDNYTAEMVIENAKTFFEQAINLLKDFPGIYRRFEIIGTTENNITVIDDYAHHPTEVKAAIQAGKEFLGDKGKLIVCFQPHLPTRLRDLWQEFCTCFEEADELFLADLYVARGKPIDGINTENLFKQIKHNNKTHILGKAENLIEPLIEAAKPNDLILILGAGDITYIREKLFEKLA